MTDDIWDGWLGYGIALERRQDRWRSLFGQLDRIPFPTVLVPAVDGSKVQPNRHWGSSNEAWACAQSHFNVLGKIKPEHGPTLILEDDAGIPLDFSRRLIYPVEHLPDDWEVLMLGGEHQQTPQWTDDTHTLVKCKMVGRTHAYVVRNNIVAGKLRALIMSATNHWDQSFAWAMMHGKIATYAPWPWLVEVTDSPSSIPGSTSFYAVQEEIRKRGGFR